MKHHLHKHPVCFVGTLCIAGYTALGGGAFYDFNTDPNSILQLFGTSSWYSTGGSTITNNLSPVPPAASNGFLSITDAANSQRGAIVFDDFDNGLVVKAFSFSMDVRIGGGTDSPADGVSINYVRSNDPVLNDPSNGWAFNPDKSEGNLPEEGATTGLAIGFDAWYSGGDGSWNNNRVAGPAPLTDDVIGVSVRLDNTLVYQYSFPTLNGALADTTSLQTGPQNPNRDPNDITTSWASLGWAPLEAKIDEAGVLTVKYKGVDVTPPGGLKTTFAPSAGRLVLVGRTGGANQNNHVDNIRVTTIPATTPTLGPVTGNPTGFTTTLTDVAAAGINVTVDTATVVVALNGTVVPATVVKAPGSLVSTITASNLPLIPAGSTNTVFVTYKDTSKNAYTGTRDFIEAPYTIIPPALALPVGAVNTSKPGFKIKFYQTRTDNQNSLGLTELELAGLLGPNVADTSKYGSDGFFTETGVINYARLSLATPDGQQGNFGDETELPGLPTLQQNDDGTPILGGYDHSALEILTYLRIPAPGSYTFGVSSDDGFRVTFAGSVGEKLSGLNVGQYNGGRGADIPGTLFTVYVPQAGDYPVRTIWENGGGGANVEWFSIGPDGTYNLINDTAATNGVNAIRAYQASSIVYPYVSQVQPEPGLSAEKRSVLPNNAFQVVLADGSSDTINQGSIGLWLNGVDQHPTITKSGSKTTVSVNTAYPNLLPTGTNVATLVYSGGSKPTVTNSWKFIVAPVASLDIGTSTPPGSGDATKKGFRIKTVGLDLVGNGAVAGVQADNRVDFAEQELLGLFGDNVANTTGFVDGYYAETGVINYDKDAAQQGNFGGESLIPGAPTGAVTSNPTDNFALEIQTYVEFPSAGLYVFGFNSDDGFATYNSTGPGPIFGLNIASPASIAGRMGARSAGTEVGGLAAPMPAYPGITGKVVAVQPPLADSDITNGAEVKGNIALIDRGVASFNDKWNRAIAAGAIGVIIVNNRLITDADGVLPIVAGGTPATTGNIPGVMVSNADGAKLKAHLSDAGGVTVTLARDNTPRLGFYEGGRGASDTIYAFTVPAAGLYPIRSIYYEGGGGANLEWFSETADGTKVLLNDAATPGSLKTYRAVTVAPAPTLKISFDGTAATITFTGTLQAATSPKGPFTDISPAPVSPLVVTPTGATPKYFRARN